MINIREDEKKKHNAMIMAKKVKRNQKKCEQKCTQIRSSHGVVVVLLLLVLYVHPLITRVTSCNKDKNCTVVRFQAQLNSR